MKQRWCGVCRRLSLVTQASTDDAHVQYEVADLECGHRAFTRVRGEAKTQ